MMTACSTLVSAISGLGLAYLHITPNAQQQVDYRAVLKPLFKGNFFVGAGLTRETASELVRSGVADAAVFGVAYLANPDLAERFKQNAPLNPPDRDTFYTLGPKGYIDYPFLAQAVA